MRIDFTLMNEALSKLKDIYPESAEIKELFPNAQDKHLQSNLFYLEEHELIEAGAKRDIYGTPRIIFSAKITARGLDFLEGEGGLSAIFNTITVKFDEKNIQIIRDILAEKIQLSEMPSSEKKSLLKYIKNISGEALKTLCLKLIGKGIEHSPNIIGFLIKELSE